MKTIVFISLCLIVLSCNAEVFRTKSTQACSGIRYVSSRAACNSATTTCVVGTSCIDNACESKRYYPGKLCLSSNDCSKGDNAAGTTIYCFENRCVFVGKYEGDSCRSDAECLSSLCSRGVCTAKQEGEACEVNANTQNFCKEGYGCLLLNGQRVCQKLNDVGKQCNVVNGIPPANLPCRNGLLCIANTCTRPLTRVDATCDQGIAGHCAPAWEMYCRRNATARPAPTLTCTKYAAVGEDCDDGAGVRCYPDLTCDKTTKTCAIPYLVCSSDADCGGQKCYCGGKGPTGAAVDGLCGTPDQRNCKYRRNILQACVSANCNPGVISVVPDNNNCMQRECKRELSDYYSCQVGDISERGVSVPAIQGFNSSPSLHTQSIRVTFMLAMIFSVVVMSLIA